MPEPIQTVVEEGKRKEGLQSHLGEGRPSSDSRDHRLRLKVPSECRRSEVCETKEVEGPGEHDAADTVESTAIPSDLRAVDGQVRGDGALETLLREDVGGFARSSMLGRCCSVLVISIGTLRRNNDAMLS